MDLQIPVSGAPVHVVLVVKVDVRLGIIFPVAAAEHRFIR
jgi:hypothetical protein